MPTYSYACTECDNRFDAVQAFTEDALTSCPPVLRSAAQTVQLGWRGVQGQRLLPHGQPRIGQEQQQVGLVVVVEFREVVELQRVVQLIELVEYVQLVEFVEFLRACGSSVELAARSRWGGAQLFQLFRKPAPPDC